MPRLRLALGALGILTALVGFAGVRTPLASMASYTAGLMVLNQIAPPLLLLAMPRRVEWSVFDPVLATIAFVTLSIAVSLPGLLDPTLANALYAGPLGILELAAGLMFWGQLLPATRQLTRPWQAALLGWAGSLPMMAVAVVWMLSPAVIYTPYLDVICRWDIPPLLDQRWAGFIMLVAGTPLQLTSAALLLGLLDRDPAEISFVGGRASHQVGSTSKSLGTAPDMRQGETNR